MADEKFRYFVELKTEEEASLTRREEAALRRQQAQITVGRLQDWLHDQGLDNKVSALTPTLFGQVEITCAADVMKRILDDEAVPVAAIRQGVLRAQVSGF